MKLTIVVQGSNFVKYATEKCLPNAPTHTQPTIRAMIDSQEFGITSNACKLITDHTINRMKNSFQPFFDKMYASADNMGSALDYLLRIGTQKDAMQDLCTNYQTNPFVVAIIPEPVDYFRACGLTSICRSRCRAEIEAFELVNDNPSITYAPYTVRSNSPFFLDLDEGSVTPMTIIALTEITDCAHVCGERTDSDNAEHPDKCLAIAGVVGDSDLTIMTYCVPTLPGVGVRRHDTWTVPGTLGIMNDVVEAKFADYARGEVIVILRDEESSAAYGKQLTGRIDAFSKGDTFINDDMQSPLTDQKGIEDSVVESFAHDGAEYRAMKLTGIMVQPARTTDTAGIVVLHAQVSGVMIINQGTDTELAESQSYNLCGLLQDQGNVWGMSVCNADVWGDGADLGHVIWMKEDPSKAAIVPGSGLLTTGSGQVRIVEVSTSLNRLDVIGIRPFKSSMWSLMSGIPATTRDLDFSMTSKAIIRKNQVISQLGSLADKGQFSVTVPSRFEAFMSNSPSSPTHWLSQVRLNIPANQSSAGSGDGELVTAGTYQSTEITKTFVLQQKCNFQTCNGCLDLNVQRLCYGAQQCTLARCIGTLTNQNRPLCGIGKTGQAILVTAIVMVETAWHILLETITTIIGLSLSTTPVADGIQVRWIDDGFYGAICSAKDAIVSFISVLTSIINFIAQSVTKEPISYTESGSQRIDSNFQAMFTLVVTSFNNLLSQLMLGVLYVFLALQKVAICELGSLMALISNTGFKITIGIPEIQNASDKSLGKCLTTYYSENINTPSESSNLANFATLVAGISSQVSKAGVGSFLELLKHPLDAAITWLIGLITGVQDVIQTIDMAHCKLPDFYMKVCLCLFNNTEEQH